MRLGANRTGSTGHHDGAAFDLFANGIQVDAGRFAAKKIVQVHIADLIDADVPGKDVAKRGNGFETDARLLADFDKLLHLRASGGTNGDEDVVRRV